MDEATVVQHAEAHGQAVVDGDLTRPGEDFDQAALEGAGPVIKELPSPVESADIEQVNLEGEVATLLIRYSGEGKSTVVESVWEDRDGRPKIVSVRVA